MKEDLFEEVEKIRKGYGFKNRSELLRHGINLMMEESKSMEKMKGHLDCILFIMHTKAESMLNRILHKNEDMIRTQIHNNLCNDKCLEILVMHGSSERIKDIYNSIKSSKKIDYIKLIVP